MLIVMMIDDTTEDKKPKLKKYCLFDQKGRLQRVKVKTKNLIISVCLL